MMEAKEIDALASFSQVHDPRLVAALVCEWSGRRAAGVVWGGWGGRFADE
jgi:hypothetical protein